MPKAQSCPFCGENRGLVVMRAFDNLHYVWCEPCGATGPEGEGKEGALKAWNTRVEANADDATN